jgi:hypothetical protein
VSSGLSTSKSHSSPRPRKPHCPPKSFIKTLANAQRHSSSATPSENNTALSIFAANRALLGPCGSGTFPASCFRTCTPTNPSIPSGIENLGCRRRSNGSRSSSPLPLTWDHRNSGGRCRRSSGGARNSGNNNSPCSPSTSGGSMNLCTRDFMRPRSSPGTVSGGSCG